MSGSSSPPRVRASERPYFVLVLNFRTVALGVPYILKFEIVWYGECEFGSEVPKTKRSFFELGDTLFDLQLL